MLDGGGEKTVEPVRVTVLCRAEVLRLSFRSVGESELTGTWILLAEKLIHLSIDTTVRGRGGVGIVKPALLLKLLIDAHLIL